MKLPVKTQGRTANFNQSSNTQSVLREAERAGRLAWLRRIQVKAELRKYYDAPDAEASEDYWEQT